MEIICRLISYLLLLSIPCCHCQPCFDDDSVHFDGEIWIYQRNLNVTCADGIMVPLNCITDTGNPISLGTQDFVEDGIFYSCTLDEDQRSQSDILDEEGSGSGFGSGIEPRIDNEIAECSQRTINKEWTKNNFRIKCLAGEKFTFVGCVTDDGTIVGDEEHFLGANSLLFKCHCNGQRARIETKGCFNGTGSSNADDVRFHVAKLATWVVGDREYRCDRDGIRLYRCTPTLKHKTKSVWPNSAWISDIGDVQFCL